MGCSSIPTRATGRSGPAGAQHATLTLNSPGRRRTAGSRWRPVAEVAAHLDPEEEYAFLKQLLSAVGERFPAFPTAPALLQALPSERWGVVTSGERQTVLHRFRLAGVPAPLVLVDGQDVSRGKPSPEGYLLAAHRLDLEPGACLVVEDAPAGIAAGKAAGMTVLALATTHAAADLGIADSHSPSLAEADAVIRAWVEGP